MLEPISGYFKLAEALFNNLDGAADSWNFGPEHNDAQTVEKIVKYLCKKIKNGNWSISKEKHPHEANTLRLDISKAKTKLNWFPKWDLTKALDMTISWHMATKKNSDMIDISLTKFVNMKIQDISTKINKNKITIV